MAGELLLESSMMFIDEIAVRVGRVMKRYGYDKKGRLKMQTQNNSVRVGSDELTVLQYLAKLNGRTVEDMVAEALETYLAANYADEVTTAEKRRGLPSTVILKRNGEWAAKSFTVLKSNLKQLSC